MTYDDADEELRITAISYTKLRDQMGMVGISVVPHEDEMIAKVMLVRHWESATAKMPSLPSTISSMWNKAHWGYTYITQETGEHIIEALQSGYDIPVEVITTQKLMKDGTEIERVKVMDIVEMTEYLSLLLHINKVLFPAKPSTSMQKLETQMPFWSRHTTEAGSIDYYAPGEEPDDLVRSLMICCFAARNYLGHGGAEGKMADAHPLYQQQQTTDIVSASQIQHRIDMEFASAFPNSR